MRDDSVLEEKNPTEDYKPEVLLLYFLNLVYIAL